MFIGRESELEFLNSRYQTENGQLIVLYGRRRVGKTETLREFCKDKEHVFYSCTEYTDEAQQKAFSERILSKGIPAARYINKFQDWEQAFKSIIDLPFRRKKLLIIDEFPYMVKGNKSIPSILQNLWDNILKNENIMIVLCGSSMSFIEKEVLSEKNPLYGRATGILKMKSMSYFDVIKFFPSFSIHDKILAYSILGGIPHYLKQFDATGSIDNNIKENILHRGSILYNEVEFLMRQELRETNIYNTIIEAIALGNTKLNDIYLKTQIDKSKLTPYLKNLMDLGIVEREFSVTDRVKTRANIQRGLYKLTDNYFRFWYAFVFPNISELEAGDVEGVYKHIIEPQLDEYASHIFESICIEYIRRLNMNNQLPFRYTQIGRWWEKGEELDIMATDSKRRNLILGECKFRNSKFSLSDYMNLKRKFVPSGEDIKVYYYLFSKSGFSSELTRISDEENITLISMDELG